MSYINDHINRKNEHIDNSQYFNEFWAGMHN